MPKPSKPAANNGGNGGDEQKESAEQAAADAFAVEKRETPEERLARTVVLSEEDAMWMRYRHLHFGAVSRDVSQEYRRFVASNSTAQVRKKLEEDKNQVSMAELGKLIRGMPKYQSIAKGFSKHINLSQVCYTAYRSNSLERLGDLEQDLATGLDADGRATNEKTIRSRLIELCQSPDVAPIDKLRLLMVYVATREGLPEANRRQFLQSLDPRLQGVLLQLENAILPPAANGKDNGGSGGEKLRISKARQTEFAKHLKALQNDPSSMILQRYLPALHTVMANLVGGSLDPQEWICANPDVVIDIGGGAGGAGVGQAQGQGAQGGEKRGFGSKLRWRRGGNKDKEAAAADKPEEDLRPRFVVYVMGGVSWSEIRCAHELAQKLGANLFIGGNTPLVAREYIRLLAGLSPRDFLQVAGPSPACAGDDGWRPEDEAEDEEEENRLRADVYGLDAGAAEQKQQLQF